MESITAYLIWKRDCCNLTLCGQALFEVFKHDSFVFLVSVVPPLDILTARDLGFISSRGHRQRPGVLLHFHNGSGFYFCGERVKRGSKTEVPVHSWRRSTDKKARVTDTESGTCLRHHLLGLTLETVQHSGLQLLLPVLGTGFVNQTPPPKKNPHRPAGAHSW